MIHILEELIARKRPCSSFLRDERFLQLLGRLLIVFDERGILYFDAPKNDLIERHSSTSQQKHIERYEQSFDFAEQRFNGFIEGGAIRIFLSLTLQALRKTRDDPQLFAPACDLMRFLVLREESPWLQKLRLHIRFGNAEPETAKATLLRSLFPTSHRGKDVGAIVLTIGHVQRTTKT